jgi:hypothetical protein
VLVSRNKYAILCRSWSTTTQHDPSSSESSELGGKESRIENPSISLHSLRFEIGSRSIPKYEAGGSADRVAGIACS